MFGKTKLVLLVAAVLSGASAFAGTAAEPTEADAITASEAFEMGCNAGMPKTTEAISIDYHFSTDKPTDPLHTTKYFIVTCAAGAYNSNSILLHQESKFDGTGFVSYLAPVALSTPITNKAGKITGFIAEVVTSDLSYDKATKEFTTFAKGRGIGDSFVSATYAFNHGYVILRKYVSDNTFDGKVNPKTVYEAKGKLD